MPATLFLITGWWDKANYQSNYLEIHSHGDELHHNNFCRNGKCGFKGLYLTKEELKADLQLSVNKIGTNLAFCYPFYAKNNTMIEALKETGFSLAFVGGNRKARQSDNKYAVPRYVVYKNTSLNSFIKQLATEHKNAYVTQTPKKEKSFVDKSVQNLVVNSIIEGYFPKENLIKDMAIRRINKTLCVILSLLITVVVVSYYFVISCEVKLNDLSRQTIILNNENEELQNKLDTLKSFNNVDKTLQKNNMFQRAGQVIEAPQVKVEKELPAKTQNKRIFKYAIGF